MTAKRTFVRFGAEVQDDLFEALGWHLRLGHRASVEDVQKHALVILGGMHRAFIQAYHDGHRFDAPSHPTEGN